MSEYSVIVDLDGTLVDVESIRYLVEGPKKDFDTFHSKSVNCPVNPAIQRLVQELSRTGFSIIIVSGRSEKFRNLSESWLRLHNIPYESLHLRSKNDYRKDDVFKSELGKLLISNFRVLAAVDDREDIRNVWKELTIPFVYSEKIDIGEVAQIIRSLKLATLHK